jgi:hypothetical protein
MVVQPVTLIEWYMNFYQHVYDEDEDEEAGSSSSEEQEEEEEGAEGVEVGSDSERPSKRRREGNSGGGVRVSGGGSGGEGGGRGGEKALRVMEGVCGGAVQVELCCPISLKATGGFKPLPLNTNPGFKMCLSNSTCAATVRARRRALRAQRLVAHGEGPGAR